MPANGSRREISKLGLHAAGIEFAGSVEPAQRRENLGIEVSGCVESMTRYPASNEESEVVVEQ